MIDGHPYLLLNLGAHAYVTREHRGGLDGVFGSSVPLDPRALAAYVRDVSLISAAQYAQMQPPLTVASFPSGLANPDLQYSGVYEDGWVGRESYFVLGAGPAARLEVHANVPQRGGGELDVLLDGRRIARVAAPPGPLSVFIPASASRSPRRVDLRFAKLTKLPAPDLRPVSALLTFVGFVQTSGSPG